MEMDTYRTAGWIETNYPSTDFTPLDNGTWAHFANSTGWWYKTGGTNTATCTGIHIPSGANWAGVTYWLYDTDAAADIQLEIYKVDLVNHSGSTLYTHVSSGSSGQQQAYQAFTTAETGNNDRATYAACHFAGTTSNLRNAPSST